MKDIHRIISSLCQVMKAETCAQLEIKEIKLKELQLWTHEVWRTFADRLVCSSERVQLLERIRALIPQFFKIEFSALLQHLK